MTQTPPYLPLFTCKGTRKTSSISQRSRWMVRTDTPNICASCGAVQYLFLHKYFRISMRLSAVPKSFPSRSAHGRLCARHEKNMTGKGRWALFCHAFTHPFKCLSGGSAMYVCIEDYRNLMAGVPPHFGHFITITFFIWREEHVRRSKATNLVCGKASHSLPLSHNGQRTAVTSFALSSFFISRCPFLFLFGVYTLYSWKYVIFRHI